VDHRRAQALHEMGELGGDGVVRFAQRRDAVGRDGDELGGVREARLRGGELPPLRLRHGQRGELAAALLQVLALGSRGLGGASAAASSRSTAARHARQRSTTSCASVVNPP
jgi:hypothetical protein